MSKVSRNLAKGIHFLKDKNVKVLLHFITFYYTHYKIKMHGLCCRDVQLIHVFTDYFDNR